MPLASTTLVGCRALLGTDARLSDSLVDIEIQGELIAAIRPHGSVEPAGDAVDMRGRLVTAGLINGHHHSHEGYYKGRKDNLPLELWMNYVRPLKPIEYTPREVYLRTMIGAIEALRSGTTTICDDTNVSPRIRPDYVDAIFQAYADIGSGPMSGSRSSTGRSSVRCPSWTRSSRSRSSTNSTGRRCTARTSSLASSEGSPAIIIRRRTASAIWPRPPRPSAVPRTSFSRSDAWPTSSICR
jgi:hypothetical protein